MKKILALGLALFLSAFAANSALALTANHSYTVGLYTVSTTGQQTGVEQMDATTGANGKLSFQFTDVPDTGTAPFLMVQITDTSGGQQQVGAANPDTFSDCRAAHADGSERGEFPADPGCPAGHAGRIRQSRTAGDVPHSHGSDRCHRLR